MLRIIAVVLVLTFLFEGTGITILEKLKVSNKGFAAPMGFAFFFVAIQLLYYPAQILNLSFNWIIVSSFIVLAISIVLTIISFKKTVKAFFHRETLLLLLAVGIFAYAYSSCYLDVEFSDTPTYLNYIAQNINISHLNLFDPTNGITGKEWDILYLYQGYYHFVSFTCWLINIPYFLLGSTTYVANITVTTWTFGLLYSIISSMFIINLISYFNLRNKWLALCILFYCLFYLNFYYWKVAFAFYGNTFRTLFVAMLIFVLYRWIKDNDDNLKYVAACIIGAGIAFSSTMMFLAVIIVYGLMVYLFTTNKEKSFSDLSFIVFFIVLYVAVYFGHDHLIIGIIIFVLAAAYYCLCNTKWLRRIIYDVEDFFFDHGKLIFLIIVPVILAALSLYINLTEPLNVANYGHYFEDHTTYDMVKDYFFINSNIIDNILNVMRWVGVVLLFLNTKTSEDKFIRCLIFCTVLVFLNPLTITALARYVTGIVYYRAFEIIFNPFTEMLFMFLIYDLFQWNKVGQWVMEFVLLGCVLLGNIFSFTNNDNGLYTFYVNGGRNTDPLLKIDAKEAQAIQELKAYIDANPLDHQPIIIAQSSATRSFIPEAYQIFTQREYYYPYNRVDWNFYEITKRHYPWEEHIDTPYDNTCMYLDRYNVDYIMLEYWENLEFDSNSDGCSLTIFTGSNWKIKVVDPKYKHPNA